MDRRLKNGILGLAALVLAMFGSQARSNVWSAQDYDLIFGNFLGAGPAGSAALYIPKDPLRAAGVAGSAANHNWPTDHLGLTWSTTAYNFIAADFNGDNFTDLLLQSKSAGPHHVLLNDQGTFPGISQTIANSAFGLTWSASEHNILAGDFNGDGKVDLFLQATKATGTNAIVLADTSGNLFTASSSACGYSSGPHLCWSDTGGSLYQGLKWSAQEAIVLVGNFNTADSKADFIVIKRPKVVLIDYDVPIPVPTIAPNMNGIILSQSSGMSASFSVGQYFDRQSLGLTWSALRFNFVVGNFDRTGPDDIILQALRTGTTSHWVSIGSNGTLSSTSALTTSINWAADAVSLHVVTDVTTGPTPVPRAGLVLQALLPTVQNQSLVSVTTSTPQAGIDPTQWVPVQNSIPYPVSAVGRLAGAGSVSPDGEATYSIPLDLPPGIGLTPALSIVYRHNSGPGEFGPGWHLTGFSSITRCRPTVAQDGFAGQVLLAAGDQYCLDGNRLRRVGGGSQGSQGSEYRSEVETFSKITVEQSNANGPVWFKVLGKDGLTYEYGNTTDSRDQGAASGITRAWLLNKIIDRSDNFISFTYSNIGGKPYPFAVKYGGIGTGTQAYTLSFGLEEFGPSGISLSPYGPYSWSRYVNVIHLLDDQNSQVRAWHFHYYSAGNGAPSRALLGSVQACAANSNECLPLTTVKWKPGTAGWGNVEGNSAGQAVAGAYPLDANGDGFEDLIYMDANGSNWKVIWGSASGASSPTTISHDFGAAPYQLAQYARPVDFDNDGRTDLFVHKGSTWWWLRHQSGTTFTFADTGEPAMIGSAIADVTGDGYPDLIDMTTMEVETEPGGPTTTVPVMRVRYHNRGGTPGFLAEPALIGVGSGVTNLRSGNLQSSRHRNIDVDGDGLQDLLATVNGTHRVLYSRFGDFLHGDAVPADVMPVHVNADACTDLMTTTSPKNVYVSKCLVTGAVGLNSAIQTGSIHNAPKAADWDGDGYDDILSENSGNWWLARSSGTNFNASASLSLPHSGSTPNQFVLDLDGNLRPDLLYLDSGNAWRFRRNVGDQQELVESVTDGLENIVSFSYAAATLGSACYTPTLAPAGSNGHLRPVVGRFRVACNMTASAGNGSNFQISFTYQGAKTALLGRGYAGFAQRTVKDHRTNLTTTITQRQDFPLDRIIDYAETRQQAGNTLVETVDNAVQGHAVTTSGVVTTYPFIQQSIVTSHEVGGALNGQQITRQTVTTALDSYGNPTSVTTETKDLQAGSPTLNETFTAVVNRQFAYGTANTNWCIKLPERTTVSETLRDGTSRTRTFGIVGQGIDYAECRVTHDYVEPDSNTMKVTTEYSYAPAGCGNVTAVTITGRKADGSGDLAARQTSFGYGSKCRFPETITNAVGEQTARSYDYRRGVLSTETDPNGLVTELTYDGFGRLTKGERPDGTSSNISRHACAAANNYCGVTHARVRVQVDERDNVNALIRSDQGYLDGFDRPRLVLAPLSGEQQSTVGTIANVAMTYDSFGRIATRSVPYLTSSNGETQYTYDILGRPTEAKLLRADTSEASKSKLTYAGRQVLFEDARQNVTTRTFDVTGALRQVVDPTVTSPSQGGTTAYGYTFESGGVFKVTVTDAAANAMVTRSNLRGFTTQIIDPDLGTSSFSFDSLGELISTTDAKNQTITFGAYDLLGRPTTRTDPGVGEGQTLWTWGAVADNTPTAKFVGRLKGISGPGYSENYEYDALSRPKKITVNADTAYHVDFAYQTQTGLLDTIEYPQTSWASRFKVRYEYQNGVNTRISDANASTVFWRLNTMNAAGQLTGERLGNDVIVGSIYDATTGLITRRTAGTASPYTSLQDLEFGWDARAA